MADSPGMELCKLVEQLYDEQKDAFEAGACACKKSQDRRRDQSKWHELVRDMGHWISNRNPKTGKDEDPHKNDRSSEECVAYALGWYFQHTEAARS